MDRILGTVWATCVAVAAIFALAYIGSPQAQVGGWAHPFRANNLTNTVVPIVNGRGGAVVMMHCTSATNVVQYVELFDVAANNAVTLGTTVPVLAFALLGNTTWVWNLPASGIAFGAGIQIAAVTAFNGSATAANVDCNGAWL